MDSPARPVFRSPLPALELAHYITLGKALSPSERFPPLRSLNYKSSALEAATPPRYVARKDAPEGAAITAAFVLNRMHNQR